MASIGDTGSYLYTEWACIFRRLKIRQASGMMGEERANNE